MNTLGEIITFSLIAFLVVGGIYLTIEQASSLGNLDEESINKLEIYEPLVVQLQNNYSLQFNNSQNLTSYEPNQNSIGDFFKEFNEAKSRTQQILGIVRLVYKYPDILLLSIPFVDEESVSIYRSVIWLLITISIFFAIYNAIMRKEITPQG